MSFIVFVVFSLQRISHFKDSARLPLCKCCTKTSRYFAQAQTSLQPSVRAASMIVIVIPLHHNDNGCSSVETDARLYWPLPSYKYDWWCNSFFPKNYSFDTSLLFSSSSCDTWPKTNTVCTVSSSAKRSNHFHWATSPWGPECFLSLKRKSECFLQRS